MRRAFFICGRHVENKYVENTQGAISQGEPTPGSDPRSRPNHAMGGTATDSAGLRISHENPVFTTNRRGLARRYSRHSRWAARSPRPWRGQIHQRRIRSSKIWKAGKCANTPAEHATIWRYSRGNRHCGNRYCGIRDQGPESSGIGQWHPAPAAVIRKIRCASPLVLLAPGPAGPGLTSREPNTPEPRFLDIFQDCMLVDDGKGPDAQRPARRGSTQIIPLYTPPSTRRLEARTA